MLPAQRLAWIQQFANNPAGQGGRAGFSKPRRARSQKRRKLTKTWDKRSPKASSARRASSPKPTRRLSSACCRPPNASARSWETLSGIGRTCWNRTPRRLARPSRISSKPSDGFPRRRALGQGAVR